MRDEAHRARFAWLRGQTPSLPYRAVWPVLAGAVVGLLARWLVFTGEPGDRYAPMLNAFVYFVPLFVGALTVYLAELSERRSWSYYVKASFLANVFFVLATVLVNMEGWICALVIVPLFAVVGILGGLMMGVVCRLRRGAKSVISCLAVLPIVLGYVEADLKPQPVIRTVSDSQLIAASPEAIWRVLLNTGPMHPDDVGDGWMYRIGVPTPESGVTAVQGRLLVRDVRMRKGIRFRQLSDDWEPARYVRWRYEFRPDSIPPRALDDHVRIGGEYFDLGETVYELKPVGKGTILTIRMTYRVSTQFNWYADAVARLLFKNFESVILDFYRRRSEPAPA